jgi:hypothetical protein
VIAAAMIVGTVTGGSVGLGIARMRALDSYQGCTVTDRDTRAEAEQARRTPRITTDCGVFTVSDELLRLHFTSADVYTALEPGRTVDFTTVGPRVDPLGWLPNILEVTK